jgi:glycine cleavage system H protein
MSYPKDYRYTKEHEWAKQVGDTVLIGITDHAQSSLGDIVYLELPAVGKELKSGQTFGVVESIKAVSDLYAPVSGVVTEVNSKLSENPGTLNQSPHDQGWLVRVKVSDPGAVNALMDAAAYEAYVKSLS